MAENVSYSSTGTKKRKLSKKETARSNSPDECSEDYVEVTVPLLNSNQIPESSTPEKQDAANITVECSTDSHARSETTHHDEIDQFLDDVYDSVLLEQQVRAQQDYEILDENSHDYYGEELNEGDQFEEITEMLTLSEDALNTETLNDDEQESYFYENEMENQDEKGKAKLDQQPLYPGASIKIGAAMVLLSLYAVKFNLPADAISRLLLLLNLMLPCGHVLPTTLNRFKKYFSNLKHPFILHYYCSFCLATVEAESKTCPNTACLKDLTVRGTKSYFVELPLVEQLQTFFKRPSFYSDIQYRFNRKKLNRDNIEDIYDGKLYKESFEKGILSSSDNISFLLNTDGVPVFKSSKVSIWPLYLVINELPYQKRMAKENMIFAGLWFGEKKPAMFTFLKPHLLALKTLESGVEFDSPERGTFKCKAILLATTSDLPARCLLCNSMQYNGECGCWKCLQPGKTFATSARGHTWIYPYQENDPSGPIRTLENVKKDAKRALDQLKEGVKRYMVNGVKGPSWLSILDNFDIVRGTAIDYMHGVLLGVQKHLLTMWFSPSLSGQKFNISKLVGKVDKRLEDIKPTTNIKRLPRSISEHLKYWKASELLSFLLFYGLPTLYGILPDSYFTHYTLFVHAIYLLLKDSISEENLKEANNAIQKFCRTFSKLYGERYCTMNVHQLLHLTANVKDLGPLYTHSCFPFEDKNGFILKLIHGTQFIDSQIISAVCLTQKIPELIDSCIPVGSEIETVCHELLYPPKLKQRLEIKNGIYAIGSTYSKELNTREFNALEGWLGSFPLVKKVKAFNRLEICFVGEIYGLAYKRLQRRNAATVKYVFGGSNKFAEVEYFIQHDDHTLAVAHPIACMDYNPNVHITSVNPCDFDKVVMFDITNIKACCIYISIADCNPVKAYVCEFPSSCIATE